LAKHAKLTGDFHNKIGQSTKSLRDSPLKREA
jgi:hypothetical protein